MSGKRKAISLVVMPLAELSRPCIAMGILKSSLLKLPFDCHVYYANLRFAEKIGLKKHMLMVDTSGTSLFPEWIFSRYVFPGWQPDGEEHYLRSIAKTFIENAKLNPNLTDNIFQIYNEIREAAEEFVVELAEDILQKNPLLVGCTSLFHQHLPSLALLKAIKERSPDTLTIIGGANCESVQGMATLKAFPFVDIAFSGEADTAFPEICKLAARYNSKIPTDLLPYGALDHNMQKRYSQTSEEEIPRALIYDLNSLPAPNYDDYFAQLEKSELKKRITPGLLFDSSRGCWWGQKQGCTFCGLNGAGAKYRGKDYRITLKNIKSLSERHKINRIAFTDNIMDMEYFKTFLPELEKIASPYSIFYETKANLKKCQIQQFAKSGARRIQPGIEGLHDDLLRLMNKGVSAAANIQTLKYCREYDVAAAWNLLAGFPNEEDSWLLETSNIIPLLHHLQPPGLFTTMRFQRFSEYFHNQEKYHLKLKPIGAYRFVYNLPLDTIYDLAYHFEDTQNEEQMTEGMTCLDKEVSKWQELHSKGKKSPVLHMTDKGDRIEIHDTRSCAYAENFSISGLEADIYRKCEAAISRKKLLEAITDIKDASEINASITALIEKKLLIDISDKLLALAIQGNISDNPEDNNDMPSGYTLMPNYEDLFGNDPSANLLLTCKLSIAKNLMNIRKKHASPRQ